MIKIEIKIGLEFFWLRETQKLLLMSGHLNANLRRQGFRVSPLTIFFDPVKNS